MLKDLSEALVLSENYNVPLEDILFLDFSLSGIDFSFSYPRIRFEFVPEHKSWFKVSILRGIKNYFFALPVSSRSIYRIEKKRLTMNGEVLGRIGGLEEDTCDSSYLRRKGTVFVFNPISKSLCSGCKFCHTVKQRARDRISLLTRDEIIRFIERWLIQHQIPDLRHLIQTSIVTGCFGEEQRVIEYLKMIKGLFKDFGFTGELFYYGSELVTERGLNELEGIKPFTLCVSVECFVERDIILRNTKGRITIGQIKNILAQAQEKGFGSRFSYILGIEPLEVMEFNFVRLLPLINTFPVINVFQVHKGQEDLRFHGAREIEYYLEARKIIERIFMNTTLRPNPWENYRSLWYLNFGKEQLNEIRTPF